MIIFGVVFVLATLYYGLTSVDVSRVPSALIGKPAQFFRVAWVQGREIIPAQQGAAGFSLDDFKGKPVVVNFWASWCVACREEAHELEAFWQANKGGDVGVVGIAIQDSVEAALGFARQYGKTYVLGLDEDGKAGIDYGVSGVPETFIIDAKGVIVHKEVGPVTAKKLQEILIKSLGKS